MKDTGLKSIEERRGKSQESRGKRLDKEEKERLKDFSFSLTLCVGEPEFLSPEKCISTRDSLTTAVVKPPTT